MGTQEEAKKQESNFCITNDSWYPFLKNLPPHFREYTLYSYSESEYKIFAIAQDCINNLFADFFSIFHIIACNAEIGKDNDSIFAQYQHVLSGFKTVFSNQDGTELIVVCKETDALTKALACELDGSFYLCAYAYDFEPQIESFAQAISFFKEYSFVFHLGFIQWPDYITFSIDPQRMDKSSIISIAATACEKQGESLDIEVS